MRMHSFAALLLVPIFLAGAAQHAAAAPDHAVPDDAAANVAVAGAPAPDAVAPNALAPGAAAPDAAAPGPAAPAAGAAIPGTASPAATPVHAQGGPCSTTPVQALSLPKSRAALRAGRPLRIVAFGSSSTAGAGASTPENAYPAQLEARLRAALPGAAVQVINRGINGNTTADMLARLDADVIREDPVLVIWQTGSNEVLRGMDPAIFRARLEDGLSQLRDAGVEVVLMDNQRASRILESAAYARFESIMRDAAAEDHVALFSRAALMRAWAEETGGTEWPVGPDGVHHTDRGYACLAAAVAASIARAVGDTPP